MTRLSKKYPDIRAILAQKAAGRRKRAGLSFAEKTVLLDKLKARAEPIVRARRAKNARQPAMREKTGAEILQSDSFIAFSEWASEQDEKAFRDL